MTFFSNDGVLPRGDDRGEDKNHENGSGGNEAMDAAEDDRAKSEERRSEDGGGD